VSTPNQGASRARRIRVSRIIAPIMAVFLPDFAVRAALGTLNVFNAA
jgi:hypothetical protein